MEYSLLQNILLGLTLAAPIGPVNLEIIKRGQRDYNLADKVGEVKEIKQHYTAGIKVPAGIEC